MCWLHSASVNTYGKHIILLQETILIPELEYKHAYHGTSPSHWNSSLDVCNRKLAALFLERLLTSMMQYRWLWQRHFWIIDGNSKWQDTIFFHLRPSAREAANLFCAVTVFACHSTVPRPVMKTVVLVGNHPKPRRLNRPPEHCKKLWTYICTTRSLNPKRTLLSSKNATVRLPTVKKCPFWLSKTRVWREWVFRSERRNILQTESDNVVSARCTQVTWTIQIRQLESNSSTG